MSKKRLTYKDFKAYFSNNLQNKDKHQFEKEVMLDAFDEEAFEGLSGLSEEELLNDLSELNAGIDNRVNKTKRIIPVWFRYAAGIIILLGLSLSVFFITNIDFKKVSNQEMLSQELNLADSLMVEAENEMNQIMGNQMAEGDSNQSEIVAQEFNEKKAKGSEEPSRQEVDIVMEMVANEEAEMDEVEVLEFEEQTDKQDENKDKIQADEVVEPVKANNGVEPQNDAKKTKVDAVSGETNMLYERYKQNQKEEAAKKALEGKVAGVQVEVKEDKEKVNIVIRGNSSIQSSKKAKAVAAIEANKLTVKGKVIGAEDELSIPGVSIVLKDHPTIGTTTNIDGEFELAIPSDEELKTLIASFVGMESVEIDLEGDSNLMVYMESSHVEMDEVVVTAYGVSGESEAPEAEYINARPPQNLSLRKYKKAIIDDLDYTKLNSFKGKHRIKVVLNLSYLGTINEINIKKSPSDIFSEEIEKSIRKLGIWTPAKRNDNNVSSTIRVTLKIKIE